MPNTGHLMIDISSNNPLPNLKQLHKAGYQVLALKATEATSYTWDRHTELTRQWHALGGTVWHYHFARPGAAAPQARKFLAAVLPVYKPGDRLVLDIEVAGVNGKFVDDFWTAVERNKTAGGIPREDYGSPYFLRDNGVRPHHEEGLWLADYANSVAFLPTGWKHYDAWQYTDRAHVTGESSAVDQSRLAVAPKPRPVKRTPAKARKSWWVKAWRRWVHGHNHGGNR